VIQFTIGDWERNCGYLLFNFTRNTLCFKSAAVLLFLHVSCVVISDDADSNLDSLCGLVVRVPGYRTEMYCASCEVRTEFICCVEESRPPLWSSGQSSWLQNGDVLCFLWGTNSIYICYVEESKLPLWSSGQSSWLQNGDVLCFLWGTNWIYICLEESRPPLWYSGQSSWPQIRRPGFDSRRYQIFWEVVELERSLLSLVSTIEELLGRNSSGSELETRDYGRRGPSASVTRNASIRKSWHWIRRQAVVARSV
jgi:hypothetical protein